VNARSQRYAWAQGGGYTLIELMVVLAVLSILAMMTYPLAEIQAQRSKERELKQALVEIRAALDSYKRAADAGLIPKAADASGYPARLPDLVEGVTRIDAQGEGRRINFLRRLPRDPFADPRMAPELTWGLRSYDSEHDRPRPGADVFDVYSLSDKTGLNGTPLREW
jgi:general secretion pathway protein G